MLTCHLRVFFEEVSLQVFDLFFLVRLFIFLQLNLGALSLILMIWLLITVMPPLLYHGLIKGFPKQGYFSPLEDF